MIESKIVSWIKSKGNKLSKGESVVVLESDKAYMDVETFYDGITVAIVIAEGETAPVKAAQSAPSPVTPFAVVPFVATSETAPPPLPSTKFVFDGPKKIVATPQAKKLAKQHKVDIATEYLLLLA